MKKMLCQLAAIIAAIALAATCALSEVSKDTHDSGITEGQGNQSETRNGMLSAEDGSAFAYIHDPRENPEAMADIIENPEAVYGFSPSPDSQRLGSYAEYDWTDPEKQRADNHCGSEYGIHDGYPHADERRGGIH